MTTATVSSPRPIARRESGDPVGRRYGRMWARLPRELGYLALTALIGLVVINFAWALLNGGGGVLVPLAVVLLALVLLGSRYLGALELIRLRWARTRALLPPRWGRPFRGKRPLRALGDVFAGGHYWLYGLHSVLVNPILAFVTFSVWFGWLSIALAASTAAAWGLPPFLDRLTGPGIPPRVGSVLVGNPSLAQVLIRSAEGGSGAVDPARAGWAVAGVTAIGLLMLALLPFVTRGAVLAHWSAGRLLLTRFPSEDLRADVANADAARLAAVSAEDTALRRLERDIHDGPQQRLLRLQMELATAERRIADAPAAAEPLAAARRLTTETLDELRALAQGFAPPLLQDRGLSAALGALGRRGAIPVETSIAIEGDVPDAVERSVYFVAAELTANAIKHGGSSRVRLRAATEGDGADRALLLVVEDDGRGGAAMQPGHGLAGASERVAGLGGTMAISSPGGGPTSVAVRVPLR